MVTNRIEVILHEISAKHEDSSLFDKLKSQLADVWHLTPTSVNRILRNEQGLGVERATIAVQLFNNYGSYTIEQIFAKPELRKTGHKLIKA